ncbi:MAG: hypothetical protein AB2A00_03150 [Myxococcota bacterium]
MRPRPLPGLCVALVISCSHGANRPATPPAECRSVPMYEGSIHAGSIYAQPFLEPRSKTHQSLDCGSGPLAVYTLEYADSDEAERATAFFGARLWGGPGPSAQHPDELLRKGTVVVIISGANPAPLLPTYTRQGFQPHRDNDATAIHVPQDISAQVLAEVRKRLDCATSPRHCAALDGFANGAPPLPMARPSIGSMVLLGPGAGERREQLAWLIVDAGGLLSGDLRPENADEERQVRELLAMLSSGKAVPADHPLHALVASVAREKRRPTATAGRSITLEDGGDYWVRDVGNDVVVITAFQERGGVALVVGVFPRG